MVEFAMVAPLVFLLLIGLIVTGVVVMNQIRINNAARDAARAIAVCGTLGGDTVPDPGTTIRLPNGQTCSQSAVTAYLSSAVDGGQMSIVDSSGTVQGTGPSALSQCLFNQNGTHYLFVKVDGSYSQPLFVPFIGQFFGTGGTNTRTLTAHATAQCER